MAEHALRARMAAQTGCAHGFPPSPAAAAIAKGVTSNAAAAMIAIAHGVHGAIGFSEEFDLQLYTRRLHEWRMAWGSEQYWDGVLGALRLASADGTTFDFVRALS